MIRVGDQVVCINPRGCLNKNEIYRVSKVNFLYLSVTKFPYSDFYVSRFKKLWEEPKPIEDWE